MTETIEEVEEDVEINLGSSLVVHNDDVNTFEHVILTLMEVLGMAAEQAEQCAMLVHHKGRCKVKQGTRDKLKPYRDAIVDEGIDARIE